MKTSLCEMLNIEFPLFAFSHCRDVVASASKAGAIGVLGVAYSTPEELAVELAWLDEALEGRPYGIDIVLPENMVASQMEGATQRTLLGGIPDAQRRFSDDLLRRHDVDPDSTSDKIEHYKDSAVASMRDVGEQMLDVIFRHNICFIANGLGLVPDYLINRAAKANIPVGALVGSGEQAVRQVNAGAQIIIAQGVEAGGHGGEIATMVLVPEVISALRQFGDIPVLAAGGIASGKQMAAAIMMGAAGAWTGSVWLTTRESEVSEILREKLIHARSRDTVRSKARSGKYSRQLRSAWTDAWDGPESPGILGLPMHATLSEVAMRQAERSAEAGNKRAAELINYFAGQCIGLIDQVQSTASVVQEFKTDFVEAVERFGEVTQYDG